VKVEETLRKNQELLDEKERILKQVTDAEKKVAEASLLFFDIPTLCLMLEIVQQLSSQWLLVDHENEMLNNKCVTLENQLKSTHHDYNAVSRKLAIIPSCLDMLSQQRLKGMKRNAEQENRDIRQQQEKEINEVTSPVFTAIMF